MFSEKTIMHDPYTIERRCIRRVITIEREQHEGKSASFTASSCKGCTFPFIYHGLICSVRIDSGYIFGRFEEDIVPCHVRDFRSFLGVLSSMDDENDTTSSDKVLCVPIIECEDDHAINEDLSQSSGDSDDEESRQNVMEGQQEINEFSNVCLRRSSRRKKKFPISVTCVIRGGV